MKKRELAKIPVKDAPDWLMHNIYDPFSSQKYERYIMTANADPDMLILHIFKTDELKMGNTKAAYRLFQSESEYITQDLSVLPKVKWLTGKTGNVLGGYWKIGYVVTMASDEDGEVVRNFFNTPMRPAEAIQAAQDKICEQKLKQRLDQERQEIDEQMKAFQDLPDNFEDFLREEVMNEHYLFYNRKKNYCYCTKCRKIYSITGKERCEYSGFDPKEIKHNKKTRCKVCGEELTCKATGYGRSLMLINKWAVLIQANGKDIHTRIFSVYWDLSGKYWNTEIKYEELYRSVFTGQGHTYYEIAPFHNRYEERWCYLRDQQQLHHMPKAITVYGDNIPDVFDNTAYQYCMFQEYFYIANKEELLGKEQTDTFMVDNYLELYQKRPWIESLIKLGCRQLVRSAKELRADNSKKDLPEILKLNKQYFRILMKLTESDPDCKQLSTMQKIYSELGISNERYIITVFNICDNSSDVEKIQNMLKYVSLKKLINYLIMQRRKRKHITINDLKDHCKMLEELNYDIKENLLPDDFAKEHIRVSRELEAARDEKQRLEERKDSEKIRLRMEEMKEILGLRMNGLLVLAPKETMDIRKEGRTLHHCVGTYIKKVAEEKTNIFFIRKEEARVAPYFTLEIDMNGNMVQCRGLYNCDMPDEVKEFAHAFTELVKGYFIEKQAAEKKKAS